MKIGNEDVKLYLGSAEVEKIYLGTEQVYGGSEPTHDYSQDYLTIESLEDGNNTISFTMGNGMTTAITTAVTSVSVSTDDGQSWTQMQNIGARASLSVILSKGEKAIWKGEAVRYALGIGSTGKGRQTIFSSTGQFKVYGNIMSLISGDTFEDVETLTGALTFCGLFSGCTGLTSAEHLILPATTLTESCYRRMFQRCTSLTTAPSILPATTLAESCYNGMFAYCLSLTTAPELPATTLANDCYFELFNGCTSLTTAPDLPATTLAESCYASMFFNCSSLTTAPDLPATTLASNCYWRMFFNCTSLNSITCLATDISATDCTSNWVNGVASSGTFVKALTMNDWTTGASGIPDGWTVQNDDGFEDAS